VKWWVVGAGLVVAALGAGAVGYWLGRAPLVHEPPVVEAPAAPAPMVFERREAPTPRTYEVELAAAPASSRWGELNRDAIAALERGDLERAVELFEQCVSGEPKEPVFQHNLAEALVRLSMRRHETERPCAPCVASLERAVALAPEREPVRQLLERYRAELEVEKDFWSEGSQHFDLSYNGWRDELTSGAPAILIELERSWGDLALLFGVYPGEQPGQRIPVVLYHPAEFHKVTGLGHWAGGAYDGAIRVPMENGRVLDKHLGDLLRHELVHVFVRESGGSAVPGWLNEGLAQWLQERRDLDLRDSREKLRGRELIPIERLQSSLAKLGGDEDIARAYAQALLACDHIARTYGEATLFRMVSGCKSGVGVAKTFRDWTGIELELVMSDLAEELRR
jgi:hypothetical protein